MKAEEYFNEIKNLLRSSTIDPDLTSIEIYKLAIMTKKLCEGALFNWDKQSPGLVRELLRQLDAFEPKWSYKPNQS